MLGFPGAIQESRVSGYRKREDHMEERVQKREGGMEDTFYQGQ